MARYLKDEDKTIERIIFAVSAKEKALIERAKPEKGSMSEFIRQIVIPECKKILIKQRETDKQIEEKIEELEKEILDIEFSEDLGDLENSEQFKRDLINS